MNTRLLCFLVLPLFASRSMAQESKTVYFDHKDKPCAADTAAYKKTGTKENGRWHVFQYTMNASQPFAEGFYPDDGFLHGDGPFVYYHDYTQKTIMEKGLYKNGEKEGLWKGLYPDRSQRYATFYVNGHIKGASLSWYPTGELSDSTVMDDKGNGYEKSFWKDGKTSQYGPFVAWKKEGDWTYYHRNGRPSSIDKMKDDTRLSSTCFDESGKPSTQYCGLEVESDFPGGQAAWLAYIRNKTSKARFPAAYFDGKIYGKAMVQFVVDENGNVTDAEVTEHVSPELDQIALQTVKSSPKWMPARQYNRLVKSYKRQPFNFPKYPGSK